MKIVNLTPPILESALIECAKLLAATWTRGEIAIIPTETVYGVSAGFNHPTGLQRLAAFKQRQDNGANAKKFQLLLSDYRDVYQLVSELPPGAEQICQRFFPGPLTLVIPDQRGGTLGIRVPDSPVVVQAIKIFAQPVAASSANPPGQEAPITLDAAINYVNDVATVAVDCGTCNVGISSTVAAINNNCELTILRPGCITEEDLRKALTL